MNRPARVYSVFLVFALVVLAGCDSGAPQGVQSGTAVPSDTAVSSDTTQNNNLREALAVTPAGARIDFTDWTLLKKYMGLEDLAVARTDEGLRNFVDKLANQAPAAFHGRETFFMQGKPATQDWGWDFVDLLWEAGIEIADGGSHSVLRFRDDFDFAPVMQRFKEREFSETDREGIKLYSHEMTFAEEWETSGIDLRIFNVAFVPEKHLLVLSMDRERLEGLVDSIRKGPAGSLSEDESVMEMLEAMGELGSVTVMPDRTGCQLGSIGPLDAALEPEGLERLKKLEEMMKQTHAYDALATGYRYEGEKSIGLVAMHYSSAEGANTDVEIRSTLLNEADVQIEEGHKPYAEIIKERGGEPEVLTDRNTLIVKVTGTSNRTEASEGEGKSTPRLLYDLLLARDMKFAACP